MPRFLTQSSPPSVLAIDRACVEWLTRDAAGVPRWATASVEREGPGACVATALALAGPKPGACVLALGPNAIRHKVVSVPAMARSELKHVLQRKAAQIVECKVDDVLYGASRFESTIHGKADGAPRAEKDEAKAEQHWLVAGARRSEISPILLELRRVGFSVRRVVSMPLAALARAQSLRGDLEPACIVVAAQRGSVAVTLVQGREIFNVNVLEGDLLTVSSLALTVIQEVKSFDAAWRKAHRGGSVAQIVLLGLPADRGLSFQTALLTALPTAKVVLASQGVPPVDATIDTGRVQLLDACLERGDFQLDFAMPLPPQTATVCAVFGAMMVLASAAGTLTYHKVARAEEGELLEIARLNLESADLEALAAKNAQCEAKLASLRALTARNAKALSSGWPVAEMLESALGAFGADGALQTLTVGHFDPEAEIEFSGLTSSSPIEAIERVGRIVERLEASSHFASVVASPGNNLTDGERPIPFLVQAEAEGLE